MRPILAGLLLCAALSPAFADDTCLDFAQLNVPGGIPFASIAYVTAANGAGDHLVVGALNGGAATVGAINSAIPQPAITNQTFCGQIALAPAQFYSNVYVPTAAERAGNFGAFAGLLVNPSTNQPYPNGTIPAAQLGGVYAWRIGPTQLGSGNQGWNLTGTMKERRFTHSAVLLPNGKVLILGFGRTGEIYDPGTGNFQSVGPTVQDHGFCTTATLLNDGRVLYVGGEKVPSAAELFDPATGRFSATGAPLQPHGYCPTATLLKDGRVLIVGGLIAPGFGSSCADTNAGAEIYDPKTGKFTTAGPMVTNRNYHSAVLLPDGRVLIAGGELKGSIGMSCNSAFDSAEVYDPVSEKFSVTGSMPSRRSAFFAVLLPNGKVLVGGGDVNGGTAEIFDPASGTFTPTGNLNNGYRSACKAVLLSNGQVLVVGGHNITNAVPTNSTELYNPATGTFQAVGNLVIARSSPTATLLLDGRVLVTGGFINNAFQPTASAELYTPVTQGLVTAQTGLTFRRAQGATGAARQNVAVLSATDRIPWTVSTQTYQGGNWLSVAPGAGNSGPSDPIVTLAISADPTGLAAQDYYGSVTLTPSDGTHSPVSIAVVLSIVPAGAAAPPGVAPSGLVFVGAPGSNIGAQSFSVSNLTSKAIAFTAVASATTNWFDLSAKGSIGVGAGQSASVTVTPNLKNLTAGVYRGSVKLLFIDNTTQTVDLLLVLSATAPASTTQDFAPRATAGCKPTKLLPVSTTIGTGFTTPAAWPTSLIVQVVDDCGQGQNTGTVTASFSNGDPPLSLISIGGAIWTATWVPVRTSDSAVAVRVDAQSPPLAGTVQVNGQVIVNPNVPLVGAGGIVSLGDYTGAPALGLLVSIFGAALADGNFPATVPLPTQLGSTSVIVSGTQLPLQYVSPGQINVVIPYNMTVNTPLQLIVQRGNAISVPAPIAVFDTQPAILSTSGSGSGQGHIYKTDASGNAVLADAASPAKAGDVLVIYTVGLGVVTPAVKAGDPSPYPPANASGAVSVTIGGVPAKVVFAGLTPGGVGLYQVNVEVPGGVFPGGQVPVTLAVAGKSGPGNVYMGIR